MSVPNQARSGPQLTQTAGRLTPDGKRVYRMTTPVVLWWCWLGFLVLALADLLIQGHQLPSARIALGALTITAVVYAAALWPRVIADSGGIRVRNPFRIFDIPWGAVNGVYLAESVEVQCARPAPKKDKTVACWALAAPRRSRARAELRGRQWDRGGRSTPSSYARLPESARTVAKMTQPEIIARELASLKEEVAAVARAAAAAAEAVAPGQVAPSAAVNGSVPATEAARASGAESGGGPAGPAGAEVFRARWAWLPIAAMLVPAIAFAIAMLLG
ncbi:MAG: PH domain-containing protein [Streptosporangiaceae bacterium]